MKKRIVQDKNDIEFHYDRSNEFYKLMLDKNMVYSCAYFQKWDEDLDKAQENKLDLICRKLRLRPREKFLDIGCGWGSLVIWAAKNYGVEAYGITNSTSQFKLASERIEKEGLKSCCAVGLKDYRELHGQRIFDKVASVGMFEHVGVKNYPLYFGLVNRILTDNGLFLNHGITAPQIRHDAKEKFIKKYIFPNGELDTVDHVLSVMRQQNFEILDVENLRPHYTRTLKLWAENLINKKASFADYATEKEYRIHLLHVIGAASGFERGDGLIYQLLASRAGSKALNVSPINREDIYRDF